MRWRPAPHDVAENRIMPIDQQPPTRVTLEHASPWGRWGTRIAWTAAGLSLLAAVGSAGDCLERAQELVKKKVDVIAVAAVSSCEAVGQRRGAHTNGPQAGPTE